MAHEKNLDFLVEVVARLRRQIPDVLLVIAGEGPARPHLQSPVARGALESSVLFVGYLQRGTELNDCYRGGDVFVFASRSETQGLVLLESLAREWESGALARRLNALYAALSVTAGADARIR